MIIGEMDNNSTLMENMRDRILGEMVKTYQKMMDILHACGIYPKHQVFDNKISEAYKVAIKENKMTLQQVLTHNHQMNIMEKGI